MVIRLFGFYILSWLSPVIIIGGGLEEILDKYYRARGGLERLNDIETLKLNGMVEAHGTVTPFSVMVRDGKCRLEIEAGGTRVVKIFDDEKGWQINPVLGTRSPQPMNRDEVRTLNGFLDPSGPLVDWERKGHAVTDLGPRQMGDRLVHGIRVRIGRDLNKVFYLDARTGLPLMIEEARSHKKTVARITRHTEIAGITFVTGFLSGPRDECAPTLHADEAACDNSRKVLLRNVEVNPYLEDHLFRIEEIRQDLTD